MDNRFKFESNRFHFKEKAPNLGANKKSVALSKLL